MFVAALVAIFALTAIIGSIICLICLNGINAIYQFVLPVILPSSLALVCISLPIMIYVLKSHKKTRSLIKELNQRNFDLLKSFYNQISFPKLDKSKIADYIEKNILNVQANKFYFQELLQNLKSFFPPKKNRKQEDIDIIEGIDRSIENLKLSNKQRILRNKKEKDKKF